MINTILFDLDGTLLPMDQNEFVAEYFKLLSIKMVGFGYDPKVLIKAVYAGTMAMSANDGTVTNEERFWDTFTNLLGEKVRTLLPEFEHFYQNEFNEVQKVTPCNPLAKYCVQTLKDKGYALVLATNPLFPKVATHGRIGWAGLNKDDFALITTYEDCGYCKPNPMYYKNILELIGKSPEDCMMVGNDVQDDMCAANLGMDTFLLTDCINNTGGEDIEKFHHGSFEEFAKLVDEMPSII